MNYSFKVMALTLALLAATGAGAREVAGVRLDDRIRVGESDLVLNGAGVRTKFVFKVYVGALYLPQATHEAGVVLNGSGARRMLLRMLRDVDGDTLLEALRDSLKENTNDAERASLIAPMEKMAALFRAVGKVHEADVLTMDFAADGVSLAMNGKPLGKVEDGSFAHMLLRVWLGEHPVDASLKKALLGQ